MKTMTTATAVHRVIGGTFGILAVIGWGLYVYSGASVSSQEAAVRAELTQLRRQLEQAGVERDQVAVERDQLVRSTGDLQQVQRQLASGREQLKNLEQARMQLIETIAQVRSQLISLTTPSAESAAPSRTVPSSSLSRQKAQVSAVQEALTRLGFANLKPDGVLGRNTRQAIEAFDRANGLPVTGRLDTRTVQALEGAAGLSIQ